MKSILVGPTESFEHAVFAVVDGTALQITYLRAPDTTTREDDVILEATGQGGQELIVTKSDLALEGGIGVSEIRLRSGVTVGLLATPTVH
jgi:hypothetical protein